MSKSPQSTSPNVKNGQKLGNFDMEENIVDRKKLYETKLYSENNVQKSSMQKRALPVFAWT